MNGPPFDTTRAAFWLIAGVISVHAIVVAVGVSMCLAGGRSDCSAHGEMRDLLTEAMAAALAFSGLTRKP